jgi:two-component system OmpR family response regulator
VPSPSTAVARVLIVHDNASVADTVSRALRLEGHEVWAARSPDEGLALAQVHCPNAIILDLRMPLAASLSLLRTVRSMSGLTSVPVAIVTRDYHLDEPQKRELQALGAELHYAPLWLDELVTLARGLIIPRD